MATSQMGKPLAGITGLNDNQILLLVDVGVIQAVGFEVLTQQAGRKLLNPSGGGAGR